MLLCEFDRKCFVLRIPRCDPVLKINTACELKVVQHKYFSSEHTKVGGPSLQERLPVRKCVKWRVFVVLKLFTTDDTAVCV